MARLLAVITLWVLLGRAGAVSKVYVFYPSLARPLAIQEALARECPGFDITVFGRLTDLRAMAAREAPLAILAPNSSLKQFRGYLPMLQGTRNGSRTENFMLLSIDRVFAPEETPGSTIGAVGILDRAGMEAFVEAMVPGSPRVNLVTKIEDLLPLLIFGSADAVLISESNMREFRRKSRANLVISELANPKVGLLAVGVLETPARTGAGGNIGPGGRELLAALKALNAGTLALLGVDAWQ